MRVQVIVPWHDAGCEWRDRARAHVVDYLRGCYPAWDLVVAEATGPDWCKAAAVVPAVAASTADIVIVHDADVQYSADLGRAVEAIGDGACWAVPHLTVNRLNRRATAAIYDNGHPPGRYYYPAGVAEQPYRGVAGGGIVVGWRNCLNTVPLDARFVGWGQEDESWGDALRTIYGPAWRGTSPLWHLWHPPAERMTRRYGTPQGRELRRRYRQAAGDPDSMWRLVAESVLAQPSWGQKVR